MSKPGTIEKRTTQDTGKKVNLTKYFTFKSGTESYGLDVSGVKEILEYKKIFAVPGANKSICGVINLRGEVVPVIDLSYRFYNRPCEMTIYSSIIITEVNYRGSVSLAGVLIDRVEAVIDINDEDIDTIPGFSAKINPEFIKSIGKQGGKFTILLDMQKVLNIDELSIID